MDLSFIATLGPILGGLTGVAALLKIFYDNHAQKIHDKITVTTTEKQIEVSADDVAMRGEATVLDAYAKLLAETREQFEDYREYTDLRFTEMSTEIGKLREESNYKDERILLLTIDRDTLIQHVLAGGGIPIPNLRTV